MEQRGNRRVLQGVVTSIRNSKTISVVVTIYRKHPLYNKKQMQTKKYHAHDENDIAKVGDVVRIMETRPLSASKRFRLLEVVKKVGE